MKACSNLWECEQLTFGSNELSLDDVSRQVLIRIHGENQETGENQPPKTVMKFGTPKFETHWVVGRLRWDISDHIFTKNANLIETYLQLEILLSSDWSSIPQYTGLRWHFDQAHHKNSTGVTNMTFLKDFSFQTMAILWISILNSGLNQSGRSQPFACLTRDYATLKVLRCSLPPQKRSWKWKLHKLYFASHWPLTIRFSLNVCLQKSSSSENTKGFWVFSDLNKTSTCDGSLNGAVVFLIWKNPGTTGECLKSSLEGWCTFCTFRVWVAVEFVKGFHPHLGWWVLRECF